jgi:hypothetical protein
MAALLARIGDTPDVALNSSREILQARAPAAEHPTWAHDYGKR